MVKSCWKVKHKTKDYKVYINEKLGETVSIWKKDKVQTKKAMSYIKKHGGEC